MHTKHRLESKRAKWNSEVKQKNKALEETIEAPATSDAERAKQHKKIVVAHQEKKEAEAGRATELHPLMDKLQKIDKAIEEQYANAGQETLKF